MERNIENMHIWRQSRIVVKQIYQILSDNREVK